MGLDGWGAVDRGAAGLVAGEHRGGEVLAAAPAFEGDPGDVGGDHGQEQDRETVMQPQGLGARGVGQERAERPLLQQAAEAGQPG